jgi:hypothetical protein
VGSSCGEGLAGAHCHGYGTSVLAVSRDYRTSNVLVQLDHGPCKTLSALWPPSVLHIKNEGLDEGAVTGLLSTEGGSAGGGSRCFIESWI